MQKGCISASLFKSIKNVIAFTPQTVYIHLQMIEKKSHNRNQAMDFYRFYLVILQS